MDPKFIIPASPGAPLFAVSPERANRQPFPHSPSLPSDMATLRDSYTTSHSRTSSDVQGKVAQFNNLSREAAQRRRDNEAALKRAVMGREEAESETRRLREENRLLRREIEEGRGRERKVAERLDGVMEESQRSKETQTHAQSLYEKEVRRARKEAFKSSSALVKTQEELKSARNKFTLMREEVEVQRRKVDAREQEAFAAQYQLVGLQEEVDSLRQQKRIIEDERDALKTSLKVEEVARIAAEGRIALPASKEDEEFASPKKSRATPDDNFKENIDPQAVDQHAELVAARDELRLERRLRQRMDDQIHFMKMECQFQCCSCRVAERQGVQFLHDGVCVEAATLPASLSNSNPHDGPATVENDDPFIDPVINPTHPSFPPFDNNTTTTTTTTPDEPLIKFSPTTGTFYKTPSPPKPAHPRTFPPLPIPLPISISISSTTANPPTLTHTPPSSSSSSSSSFPHFPHTHTIKTTTTTIPLATTPIAPPPGTPYTTMTREEALEQIRARRGRARSVASHQGTPKRGGGVENGGGVGVGGERERRDISAPAGRS